MTHAERSSAVAPGRDRVVYELDDYELPSFLEEAAHFGTQFPG